MPPEVRQYVQVRRGLMKDLANTPTQIACGWRMYGDIARLSDLSGSEVVIDLLSGGCACDGRELLPPLSADYQRQHGRCCRRDHRPGRPRHRLHRRNTCQREFRATEPGSELPGHHQPGHRKHHGADRQWRDSPAQGTSVPTC